MKNAIFFILLFISTCVQAQEIKMWQASLQLQPEITIHKHDYASMYREGYMKTTFNTGIAATVQRNFNAIFFAEAGSGFISRKLNTSVILNKERMFPSPTGLYSQELNVSSSVSYRLLQFPLNLGMNFYQRKDATFFVKGGIMPKFLLNTKYASYKINAVFNNNIWQGYSVNAGLGFDYKWNEKFSFTNTLTYSVKNNIKSDYYTSSQNADGIILKHTFLQLNTGIKINL